MSKNPNFNHNPRFISSGVQSLDKLLGGGISVGSLLIIEEDADARYSNILGKYYLAEGVVEKNTIFFATIENEADKIFSELPAPTTDRDDYQNQSNLSNDEMKIAWRYSNLGQVDSTFDSNSQINRNYDLSRPMSEELLDDAVKFVWKKPNSDKISYDTNIAYDDLLKNIINQIDQHKQKNKILRIYIESLGSPFWNIYQECNKLETLSKFLFCLRTILRQSTAAAIITIPVQLMNNDLIETFRHSADAVIKLESFAGTERENIAALKDYHGFFSIPKLPKLNSLTTNISTIDLVFKLRRKKFIIEKLHLPPELQDSSEREQDDSLSCNSAAKRNLDF